MALWLTLDGTINVKFSGEFSFFSSCILPNPWYNTHMKNEMETQARTDMTFEEFCNEVLERTSYNFRTDELLCFFEVGESIEDTAQFGEEALDDELFGN